jgi:hypothetical protein
MAQENQNQEAVQTATENNVKAIVVITDANIMVFLRPIQSEIIPVGTFEIL